MDLIIKTTHQILNMFKIPFYYFKKSVHISIFARFDASTELGTYCKIRGRVYIRNATVGDATYIGSNGFFDNAIIGKFCSIGSNVKIVVNAHPSKDFVSTHPAFYSTLKQSGFTFTSLQLFDDHKYLDKKKGISVIIGNDVWIGSDVKIIGGVKVGNGAIIGTGAIVTKNIPPYAIVVGVPAKVIRYRFTQEQIDFLNEFEWWNKPWDWLKHNSQNFTDIDAFIIANKL